MKKPLLTIVLVAWVAGSLSAQESEWRGIPIAPENRCAPYNREEDYPYSPSVESEIINSMDGDICSPYTETCFDSALDTDIEHIIALSEAHDSGLCSASADVKEQFSSDLRNLTLASPTLNGEKGGKDAAEWLPDFNRCWFAERIIEVRRAYQLTIDQREADALEAILDHCDDLPTEYHITETVNLRSCASITCELLMQLSPDQTISVIEIIGGTSWLRVQYAGEIGYVHASSMPQPRLVSESSSKNQQLPSCGDPATTNCSELKECYGHGGFTQDHPGYHENRDTDNDGVACE